jgi:hypothetical protein
MKSPIIGNKLYNLSLFEVCEILSKSSRTISRYIKNGILHPVEVKSKKGMPEYRFCREEIDAFKAREEQWRQAAYLPKKQYVRQDGFFETPVVSDNIPIDDQSPVTETTAAPTKDEDRNVSITSQTQAPIQNAEAETKQGQEIISILKETAEILRDQLKTKDEQIKSLDEKIDQLIERDRETNILLKGLQDKIGLLDSPKMEDNRPSNSENIPHPQPQPQAQTDVQEIKQAQAEMPISNNAKEENKTRQQSRKSRKTIPPPKKGFFSNLFG